MMCVCVSMFFQDPSGGIPKGTLLAIFWTTLSYLFIAVTCGEIRHLNLLVKLVKCASY